MNSYPRAVVIAAVVIAATTIGTVVVGIADSVAAGGVVCVAVAATNGTTVAVPARVTAVVITAVGFR